MRTPDIENDASTIPTVTLRERKSCRGSNKKSQRSCIGQGTPTRDMMMMMMMPGFKELAAAYVVDKLQHRESFPVVQAAAPSTVYFSPAAAPQSPGGGLFIPAQTTIPQQGYYQYPQEGLFSSACVPLVSPPSAASPFQGTGQITNVSGCGIQTCMHLLHGISFSCSVLQYSTISLSRSAKP